MVGAKQKNKKRNKKGNFSNLGWTVPLKVCTMLKMVAEKTQCGCSTLIQSLFSSEGQPTPAGDSTLIIAVCVSVGVVLLVLLVCAPLVCIMKKKGKGFYHRRCSLLLQTCLPHWAADRGHDVTPLFIRWIAGKFGECEGCAGDGGEGGHGKEQEVEM